MITIRHKKEVFRPLNVRREEYRNEIILYDDNWNDFGYRTLFYLVYFDEQGECHEIGDVKIYYSEHDAELNAGTFTIPTSNQIAEMFQQLGEEFCSLGQTLEYYTNIKTYCPDTYKEILTALNDMVFVPKFKDKYLLRDGVQVSLLRESSAEKALDEAGDLFLETKEPDNEHDMSFSYQVQVPYGERTPTLSFDFRKNEYLPYRINVLVGKNGTGKTQILSRLANSLSGVGEERFVREEVFCGKRPAFYKVISISFSAFDSFKKRAKDENMYHSKSYVYCGIQSKNGTLSMEQLKKNFYESLHVIKMKGRYASWKGIMKELLEKDHESLIDELDEKNDEQMKWSSGQHILFSTITEVMANIENESLLLFDEPELHLHPNAIANVMRMFNKLLEEFDSYAIFATHSPLIVQELPKQYVLVLDRVRDNLYVRSPEMECFGENLTNLSKEIFEVSSTESNYKQILKKLSKKMTFEEVMELFENDLSFNAMIYLKNCYKG